MPDNDDVPNAAAALDEAMKRPVTRSELDDLLRQWERVSKGETAEMYAFVARIINALPALARAWFKLDDLGHAIAYLQEKGVALEMTRVDGKPMPADEYATALIVGASKLGWVPPRSMS
jgi:hypothetical protein